MTNSQINGEYRYANYGRFPDALPSLAAIKSQPHTCASPAFSSFLGSPSPLQQGVDCSSSQIYHQQSQFEELAFWQKQQNNMALPGSDHSQLPQQLLSFIQPVKSSHKQHGSMEPPWSCHSELQQQYLNFTEHQKRGGQLSQEVLQAISSTPLESQSQRLFLPGPLTINPEKSASKLAEDVSQKPQLVASFSTGQYFPGRTSYKGKEKVTSFSTDVQSLTSVINEQLEREFTGNRSQPNALYSVSPELEYSHQTFPVRSNVTLDMEKEDSGYNALMEFMQALKACSPPGADITDPYGDSNGPMFDIPFFTRIAGSFRPSGSVINFKNLPLTYNTKVLHSGKGKEVLNLNKKKRR